MRALPTLMFTSFAFLLPAVTGPPAGAQDHPCFLAGASTEEAAERPSPLGHTSFTLGGETASVCYGRPSARGREIMGELVPFDRPWRTGANEATALHLPFAAEVGGLELEPGSYSLYTIPGREEWEIVINGEVERWGVPIDADVRKADVGTFTRPAETTAEMVEQLTFRWEPRSETMGHLVLEWEHTRVEIPVRRQGM